MGVEDGEGEKKGGKEKGKYTLRLEK